MVERSDRLDSLGPLDGRYAEEIKDLPPFFSERALINTRIEIEARYLIALSEAGVVRRLDPTEVDFLESLYKSKDDSVHQTVIDIEKVTKHDVKAVEYTLRQKFAGTSLEDLGNMIHFGLTSEDVNNLSWRLMLVRGLGEVIFPAIENLADALSVKAQEYKDIPMIGRTHGQRAVPTTLGKEFAVFTHRLNEQVGKLLEVKLSGKLNGAVGNYNGLAFAAPEVDWLGFSREFVSSLGLEFNPISTQINSYEDMIELFQAFQRVNGVLLDLDQDMWRYISDDWLVQQVKAGEVGSSTMPQKVNPIKFENSEANLQMANAIWEVMSRELAVSRLQRDLSDSSLLRNVGLAFGYQHLAYINTTTGLSRVRPNKELMLEILNSDWAVLSEAAQTLLRRAGIGDPYKLLEGFTKGRKVGRQEWIDWVGTLPVEDEIMTRLLELTPENYLGYAVELVDVATNQNG